MASRHPDVAAGPAAVFCLSLRAQSPTIYELRYATPGDHIVSVKITAFCFSFSRPPHAFQAPCPATRKSSRSAALGLCQPPGGATI